MAKDRSERRFVHRASALLLLAIGCVAILALALASLPDQMDDAVAVRSSRAPEETTPVRATASVPPTAVPVPRGTLLLHGTGDVSFDPNWVTTFRSQGYGWAWTGLGGLFQHDDLTVINLENPVSNLGAAVPKQFNFRGDPAALPLAFKAGIDVANIGNNHGYDQGPEALLDTRRLLIANGIAPIGAGKDEVEATEAAFFTRKGWRIAVVGIANVVEPEPLSIAAPGHPGVSCNDDLACMADAVRRAAADSDLVVVHIHWGVELHPEPNAFQIQIAHTLVDAGADIIFGGHSHRLGGVDLYRGRPVFWSLGNFVWPAMSVAGATTGVAEVVVSPSGTFRARIRPAYINPSGHPVLRG